MAACVTLSCYHFSAHTTAFSYSLGLIIPVVDAWGSRPAIKLVNQVTRSIQHCRPYLSYPSATFPSFVLSVYQRSYSCGRHRTFTEGVIQRKLAYSSPLSLQMVNLAQPVHLFIDLCIIVICGQNVHLSLIDLCMCRMWTGCLACHVNQGQTLLTRD